MAVDFQTLLTVWVAVGVIGALVSLGVGFARLQRPASSPPPAAATPQEKGAARPEAAPVAPPRPDLRQGLRMTRQALLGSIEQLLRGRASLDPGTLEEIETLLFGADIGVRTAQDLLDAARASGSTEGVRPALEARALEILNAAPRAPSSSEGDATGPRVILVVGVNGSGKTTTIGKLARRYTAEGQKVLVAAADTFRAAAVDQLEVWAERAGAQIVKGAPGGDPAAVAFDAVAAATVQQVDVVLIDTAGRLQTHSGLMDELTKIGRAVQKQQATAPHEVLLVLDANTGQNAIRQAEEFTRATGVTGIVLSKLDGTAKGGVILGISQELGVPVRYVGIGESIEDLVDFTPEDFIEALFRQ